MGLDLYIKSKTPIKKRGTGVYVRENGKTRELKTVAEVGMVCQRVFWRERCVVQGALPEEEGP